VAWLIYPWPQDLGLEEVGVKTDPKSGKAAGAGMGEGRRSGDEWLLIYMGVVQKVLVFRVVFDDLWHAKMTFGES